MHVRNESIIMCFPVYSLYMHIESQTEEAEQLLMEIKALLQHISSLDEWAAGVKETDLSL